MQLRLALFHWLHVEAWPSWARRVYVLSLLPRKRLDDLPFVIRYAGFKFSGNAINLIDYHLLSRGAFEPGLARLMRIWASRNPNKLFLDVGANIGVHTLALASAVIRIVAVEPYPPVADRLAATLAANKITNVELARVALSNTTGVASFLAPDSDNLGVGRVVVDAANSPLLKVPQDTGDALLKNEELPIGIVKIDVEGFELAVLDGLKNRLMRDRPLVIVEVLTSGIALHQALKDHLPERYRLLRLLNARRKSCRIEEWTGTPGDIVAVPEEGIRFLTK